MVYLTLVAGLGLLLICGDFFVRGSVALALKLNIPTLVIGLTVVAFGTSAPELLISIDAALANSPGIAIGNVVGSNIANILLVLGLPAVIAATNCDQPFIRRNVFYVIGASLLFIAFAATGTIEFWHGAVMFCFMIAFLFLSARRARNDPTRALAATIDSEELSDPEAASALSAWALAMLLLAGIIGMPIGAHMTVESAADIASHLGVPQAAIGLTIIALGTSLPELSTTVMAAMRRECGLALGNVLGSNLFNILAIMGITAMIVPVPVPAKFLEVDLWVMLAAVLAITPFVLRRQRITLVPALFLVACYFAYIVAVFAPRMHDVAKATPM